MAWSSSDVAINDDVTAAQQQALRDDITGHYHTRQEFAPAVWSSNNTVGISNSHVTGYDLRDGQSDWAVTRWRVPADYSSGISIIPVYFGQTGIANGNIRVTVYFASGATAQATNNDNGSATIATLAVVADQFVDGATITSTQIANLANLAAGDNVSFAVQRTGSDGADTFAGAAYLFGFRISFTSTANAAA